MFVYFSNLILPLFLLIIVVWGMIKKVNLYESFCDGAKEGLKTAVFIFAPILSITIGINMLRTSGAMDIMTNFLNPLSKIFNIPEELIPISIIRPISGGGSIAIVNDIFTTYGPDSYLGKCVSVIMASSETTFYTIAVYFGAIGVKNIRHTLKCALLADVLAVVVSIIVTSTFFA